MKCTIRLWCLGALEIEGTAFSVGTGTSLDEWVHTGYGARNGKRMEWEALIMYHHLHD